MKDKIKKFWYDAQLGFNDQQCEPEVVEQFAQLIVEDCIRTIQEKIVTNGPTPANLRSYDHIDDIALKYGIKFPIPYK